MNHKKVKNTRPKKHSKIIKAGPKTSHTNPENNSIKNLIIHHDIFLGITLHYKQYN